MPLDLTAAPLLTFVVLMAVAALQFLRRRRPRGGGPLPDVPDASPTAVAIEAPGLTLPYSSLDPFAPPKRDAHGTRIDGLPESE